MVLAGCTIAHCRYLTEISQGFCKPASLFNAQNSGRRSPTWAISVDKVTANSLGTHSATTSPAASSCCACVQCCSDHLQSQCWHTRGLDSVACHQSTSSDQCHTPGRSWRTASFLERLLGALSPLLSVSDHLLPVELMSCQISPAFRANAAQDNKGSIPVSRTALDCVCDKVSVGKHSRLPPLRNLYCSRSSLAKDAFGAFQLPGLPPLTHRSSFVLSRYFGQESTTVSCTLPEIGPAWDLALLLRPSRSL